MNTLRSLRRFRFPLARASCPSSNGRRVDSEVKRALPQCDCLLDCGYGLDSASTRCGPFAVSSQRVASMAGNR